MTTPPTPSPQGAFWDQRYSEPGFAFGEKPNVFLMSQAAHYHKGMSALVPGDGEGRNGVFLAECGLRVTTVDASRIGVHKAMFVASERGVSIDAHCADLETWGWPEGQYDLVVSIYLHFPASLRPRMHAAMLKALKPGGLLLLEGYSPRQLLHRANGSVGGPHDVTMLFEPDELRRDFAGANIVGLEEVSVDLAEGKRHHGRSSVVRLIARRK
jgi:2-polyprenyl-3-methyl-5-hydroxy-6-metoxy-1,4-benzoquinol methylase